MSVTDNKTKEMEDFQHGRTNFSKKQRNKQSRGYNGHLTTAQAGSVGGEMVRKMIRRQEEEMSR